jgi:outer membrane protein TolC
VTLARGVTAARATIDAVEAQYRFGTTDLTTVLNAQADLFQAQDNLTQSQGTIRRQTVALYKALGGGWEALPPIAGPIAREGLAQAQPTNARSTR